MEDSLDMSDEKPYELNELAETIFKQRYARSEDESWEEASRRVARFASTAEDNGKVAKFEDLFYEEIVSNRFMPGGRIWYGAGRKVSQALNCFVIPVDDSREGWGQMLYDTTVISGTGGGIGANYSDVRPRGASIQGTGGVATGAVSAMKMQNGVAEELRQGGGRRAALMQCLNLTHPDIPEFLEVKLDRNELNNANVSVVLDIDANEFRKLIEEDGDIHFAFNGLETGQTVKAREIWNKIVQNSWDSGEPGVLNGHLANHMNNIYYYEKLISTNPCGEIWLGAYDCCCLGAVVLPRFVKDGKFDWDQFDQTVRLAVRFLDNILTVNDFPLPQIKEKCQYNRRIGAGVTGLHTMLLELGLEYDSEEGYAFVDKLFDFYKNTAYDESATLAAEKGPFPGYSPEFLKSGFVKTLKRGIKSKIKHHGIRNCALMTIAPTGTTTMVCNSISTGIEPLFAGVFWRRWKVTDEKGYDTFERELVVTDEYRKYGKLVRGAYDISVRGHFEMQKVVQKHIDNAVSKTINLPQDFPVDELSDVWLEYLPYCKGTTFYRAGSRGEEPLVLVPIEEAEEVIAEYEKSKQETAEASYTELNSMDCIGGACSL
jgi:ribonucleoside-diphosphate reductase alpha chain